MDEYNLPFLKRVELDKLQLERLQHTITRVYENSVFYSGRFDELEIEPQHITSLEDLRRLPFTTREDIRAQFPFGLLSEPLDNIVRVHTSTGTTGKPKAIFFSKRDILEAARLVARCLAMTGAHPGDVFQNMMTYGLFTGGLMLHYGAEHLGLLVVPAGAGNTERQIELMLDFGTSIVHITPSYALYLADVLEEKGIDPREQLKLRIIYMGAEPHSEKTRERIEHIYGAQVFDCYGLSEMNGPGVAFECPEKNGLHLWEDNFIPEIIDPVTGESVQDGELGELVLTSINREAMPILRYRTGDITSILNEVCPCGRTSRRIARLKGRVDDMFIVRGVNVFPSEIERLLMETPEVARNYQIVLERDRTGDTMRIRVEIQKQVFDGSLEHLKNVQEDIRERVRSEIMVTPKVELLEPGTLPTTTGKSTRVIDKREL